MAVARLAPLLPRRRKPVPANGGREHYLRAHLDSDSEGHLTVRAFEDQDSSLISIFAAANALIQLSPNAPALKQGALVDVIAPDIFLC